MAALKVLERAIKEPPIASEGSGVDGAGEPLGIYEVSRTHLNAVKRILQAQPGACVEARQLLVHKLKSRNKIQQAKALFLMDYLFCRSYLFRSTLCENISFVFDVFDLSGRQTNLQVGPTIYIVCHPYNRLFVFISCIFFGFWLV